MAAMAARWNFHPLPPGRHYDFGQTWFAARAVLASADPYTLIGPGKPFVWPNAFFYPLPAALLILPLAPFTEPVATALFTTLGAFGFAWAVTRWGYGGLWAFASVAVLDALTLGQWSLALSASIVVAPFAMLLVAKPTIGAALFVARPRRWVVSAGVVLVTLAFIVQPHWLSSWLTALSGTSLVRAEKIPYVAPVVFPGGALVLLALTRWRRWDARLLVAMACVPHTTMPYETVPLFLIPQTSAQMLLLVALSYVPMLMVDPHDFSSIAARVEAYGRVLTVVTYLPALAIVLRRPNEGFVPAWMEHRMRAWPDWLRGRTIARV